MIKQNLKNKRMNTSIVQTLIFFIFVTHTTDIIKQGKREIYTNVYEII